MWSSKSTVTPEYRRLRPMVWRRDAGRCQWPLYSGVCGLQGFETDHIVNRANGGSDTMENLRVLCKRHHNRKTADEAAEGRRRRRQEERHVG